MVCVGVWHIQVNIRSVDIRPGVIYIYTFVTCLNNTSDCSLVVGGWSRMPLAFGLDPLVSLPLQVV